MEVDEAVTLRLDKKGPGDVTAADLQLSAGVEILNPELHIATVNAKGHLAIDVTVDKGRGYVSADRNKRSNVIGVIPVDSIFSPVRRVTYTIEPVRVEQSTDFDRLVLDIETDGTISPREALASAGATLGSLVGLVASLDEAPQALELGDVGAALGASSRARRSASRTSVSPSAPATASSAPASTRSASWWPAAPRTSCRSPTSAQTSLKDVNDRLDERGLSLRAED